MKYFVVSIKYIFWEFFHQLQSNPTPYSSLWSCIPRILDLKKKKNMKIKKSEDQLGGELTQFKIPSIIPRFHCSNYCTPFTCEVQNLVI